ncbi:6-pyruvoyltetrahydropterin synthase [Nitrospira sp.]|nr:6-pyruvoyltetrahydropterin synthase [Nitrospira sp.]
MSLVYLTKGIEFAAAHRYLREEWDEARNREVFGACYNAPGHGHNYFLDVTVAGHIDPATGMVVNLYDLKIVLKAVLEEFDHKHLNLDTPYFKDTVPTMENIARVLWRLLERHRNIGTLHKVQLAEDEDLRATVTGSQGLDRASISRRYGVRTDVPSLSSRTGRDGRGYDDELWVTVEGPIDAKTGMVIDLRHLDRVIHDHVLTTLPNAVLELRRRERAGTGEEVTRFVWDSIASHLHGARLEQIKIIESRDLAYACAG